ncbi:MAG: phosphoribosylformylglycinamidine synthase subunit PurQ [Symbiobacteriia bacterium]
MRTAVVVFPGSNCDVDAHHALGEVLGQPTEYVWHEEQDLSRFDAIVLPGGFSYGDYLRAGAIAQLSPVMQAVRREAAAGKLVLGICNGFQVLCEAGLLPGALQQNEGLSFRCEFISVRVENPATPFTRRCRPGQVLRLPIAHGQGNYYADEVTLRRLEEKGQVILRYATAGGEVTPAANPNGSLANIAGIVNEAGNVFGLMPHPERATEDILGSADGRLIFASMIDWVQREVASR